YGLRYDYFGVVRERDNRAVVVDPQTGKILPSGTPFYRAKKDNFEPRFGLAYQLPFERGIFRAATLRAGVGVYSGAPRISDLVLPIESDRFSTGRVGGVFPTDPNEIIRDFTQNPETRQFQPLAFASEFTSPERTYKWDGSLTRTLGSFFGDFYDLK